MAALHIGNVFGPTSNFKTSQCFQCKELNDWNKTIILLISSSHMGQIYTTLNFAKFGACSFYLISYGCLYSNESQAATT